MFNKHPDNEKGMVLVLVALCLTVLLGMCALVVDVGLLYVQKAKLQNAIDASALAGAQELPNTGSALTVANQYIVLNGFSPTDVDITFSNGNNTIDITGTKTVNFIFAKVLGFNSSVVGTAGSATNGSAPNVFNYALFSGSKTSPLTLTGASQKITGSSHTNKNCTVTGANIQITGVCEAVTTVLITGAQTNITTMENAPYIAMPDFSDTIKTLAIAAGQNYNGDKTFTGSNIDISSPIYVTGNVTVTGSHFSGKGTIVATGSITLTGSDFYNNGDDAVCFYSKSGDITITGANAVLHGMVYAPNGTITMTGASQTVYGRVIGNIVTMTGASTKIISSSNDLKSLPFGGVKLTK